MRSLCCHGTRVSPPASFVAFTLEGAMEEELALFGKQKIRSQIIANSEASRVTEMTAFPSLQLEFTGDVFRRDWI